MNNVIPGRLAEAILRAPVPIKDIAPPDRRVSEFLETVRQDAADHLNTAIHFTGLRQWEDAEIHSEIAHERLKLAADIELELEAQA